MNREILLVEDDERYRASIKYLFKLEPYRFVEAGSPEEGIELLDANPQIRVILLDLSFQHGKGTAVLDHIRERSGEYRVIVLTGHDELLAAEKAGAYAVFNYLPKAQKTSKQAIRFSVEQAFKDLEREHLDQKLKFLLDVQRRINASHDMKETLDLICQSIRSALGAYTCHIRVYDFRRGDYHLGGFAGAEENLRQAFARPRAKGDLFSGRVVKTGKPEVFDDLQSLDDFLRFAAEALDGRKIFYSEEKNYWRNVRSAYIVPISTGLFGNAVDAVLNVSSDAKSFFNLDKRTLVDEFVTQAALSITKDWLQKKREEIHQDYSKISRMLSDMSDRLRGTEALKGIYDVVTQRISKIVNPEVVSIFLYNDMTGLIENVAEFRGDEPVTDLDEVYEPGQSFTGAVYQREATIQLPEPEDLRDLKPLDYPGFDHHNKEEYLNKVIPSGELRHYLGVPIRIGGKVSGVLRAMNKKSDYYDENSARQNRLGLHRLCLLERGFSADCRNVMEITASHLAVAIRNAELLREKDSQVEQVRTLGEVGRLINSRLDIEEVLKLTIQEMAEVMQAEICMLFLRDGEDRIILKQSFGISETLIPNASYEVGEGVTGGVAKTGKPRLIVRTDLNDGKYDPQIISFLREKHGEPKHIESLMAVPIIAKDTVLGVMKVINKVGDHLQYRAGDLELFRTFADYVSVAIENAQIYKLANDRLAIAERNSALSLLVSAVAHEINNTSGLIPANVAGIRKQLGMPNENIKRMLALIEDAASQATEFANELAGFSANRTGDKRALDVNTVIRDAIEALKFDLPKHKNSDTIQLDVSLCDHALICDIYRTPFDQIVRNIVINAFQALESKPRGVVRVSSSKDTSEPEGAAVIQFEDNGPGIKPEHKLRIFEPDFTTKAKGNGLGLWLVRTQLQQVGGTIEVESEQGQGARFTVRIPLSAEAGSGAA